MNLVEKELTQNNIELAKNRQEFLKSHEVEEKYVCADNARLEELYFKDLVPIEQVYISSPVDESSLRVRKAEKPEGTSYSGTLKDRGELINGALDRLEINTDLPQQTYEYYLNNDAYAPVRKLRATPYPGISVDFFEDGLVLTEIEDKDPEYRKAMLALLKAETGSTFTNVSALPEFTNEALAHQASGIEAFKTPEQLDAFVERVTNEALALYATGKNQVVLCLKGMSGSGKTTVTRAIKHRIVALLGEDFEPAVISTDNYHFGKQRLDAITGTPWTDWDGPRTYNTAELAADLMELAKGNAVPDRHFNFSTEEPVLSGVIKPSPIVVVEGLYAGSKDLDAVRDLYFELPTSKATSISRDIRRLVIEDRANRAFPTPESRLKHQLVTALPAYEAQEQPAARRFSACGRVLAERAFALAHLGFTQPGQVAQAEALQG